MSRPEIACALRPGDVGEIVRLHGVVYAREHGFDATFEAYVAEPLAQCVLRAHARERIWLARTGDALVGCVAIVAATLPADAARVAQLRWFLVAPQARGCGLGTRLLDTALAFARTAGYARALLWTVSELGAAARLYAAAGFVLAESRPARLWGRDLVEERHELLL